MVCKSSIIINELQTGEEKMTGKELYNLLQSHRATLTIDDLILLSSEISMQLLDKYSLLRNKFTKK